MQVNIKNIKISGISATVPKNKFNMSELFEKYGDLEVNRIIASTGIESVRVATSEIGCMDLCSESAKRLLHSLNIQSDSVDGIIFVSQTPEYVAPATSVVLQDKLGLSNNVVAFDINYGCSGYIYGLYQAALLINSGCRRVLMCAGDVITPYLDENDRQVRMVLGDAGSATIIEVGEGDITFCIKTDGSGAKHLMAKKMTPQMSNIEHFKMDGAKVMEFALKEVPSIINEIFDLTNWNRDSIDIYALHQPNKFMLNYIRKKACLPKESVISAVEKYGNTGPASIPLVLSDQAKDLKILNRVIMCGFGVGLSWGAVALSLTDTKILPVSELS